MLLDTSGNLYVNRTITSQASGKYLQMGCENATFAHHQTNADWGHWFNKNIYVNGDIYGGPSYAQKALLEGSWTHHQVSGVSDTFSNWASGLRIAFYHPGAPLSGQPSPYGNVLSIGNTSEISQLYATQASGPWYHRQANGSGWSTGWIEFYDKTNFARGTGSPSGGWDGCKYSQYI